MKTLMDLAQTGGGDMRINFGRTDAGMTQKLLDHTQIRSMFQQMCRKTVTQTMRCDALRDTGCPDPVLDPQP